MLKYNMDNKAIVEEVAICTKYILRKPTYVRNID